MLKLRPYRVDYFDIEEMKDNDFALVRSSVVRAVTSSQAIDMVLGDEPETADRIIIRASRFYKKLVHKQDAFKAVEDLFTANKAVKVMEQVEAYRTKKTDVPATPPVAAHVTRLSDSTLYDEVCVNCGATDASGKLDQPCPVTPVAVSAVTPTQELGTGPDSPATKAVIADMQGMIAHDAHEQTMDTFVPASVPEGKRFPDPANLPITQPIPPTGTVEAVAAAVDQFAGFSKLIEPDQAVGPVGRPHWQGCSCDACGDNLKPPTPLATKVLVFGFTLLAAIGFLHYLLRH